MGTGVSSGLQTRMRPDNTGRGGFDSCLFRFYKMLKILHVVNVPWYNAVAWYALQTAIAQKQHGHSVIVAGDPGSPSVDEAERLGMGPGLRLPFSAPNPAGQWLASRGLRSFIEKNAIDVVNAHQGNGYFFIARAARSAKPAPLLVRTRGDVRPIKRHF